MVDRITVSGLDAGPEPTSRICPLEVAPRGMTWPWLPLFRSEAAEVTMDVARGDGAVRLIEPMVKSRVGLRRWMRAMTKRGQR